MSRGKKFLHRGALAFLAATVALQFFRPARNNGPTAPDRDLLALHPAPPAIKELLAAACYDCHSNRTRYPWYAEIQPVGWWLAHHVDEGREELNFSTFASLSKKQARRKLEACIDQLETREMPLRSYTLTHTDARLSDAQIKSLVTWLEATVDRLDSAN